MAGKRASASIERVCIGMRLSVLFQLEKLRHAHTMQHDSHPFRASYSEEALELTS